MASPLQQCAAFADSAGARLVRLGADILADAGLVGLVGVPVDEPAVMVFDEHLPLVLRQHMAAHTQLPVLADTALLAGPAIDVGTGVGRMGQHRVHRVVGRLDPRDVLVTGDVPVLLQREFQAVVAKPQPHAPHRPGHREPLEDRADDTGDRLVGMPADLPVGIAPDQPDWQAPPQLAARGLVADAAIEAGPQDMQLSLGHGALHPEQQPVVEQRRMVDTVSVGDQRVGHPRQIQQPIPVGVVAGQLGHLQRQHDPHLPEPDLGGQFGKPRSASRAGPAHTQVVVDHSDRAARPAQLLCPGGQVVLASGGLDVAFHLRQSGLPDIDHGGSPQLRGGDLMVTHRRPPRSRPPRSPWRSPRPAA